MAKDLMKALEDSFARCTCGHLHSVHNELGYCTVKRRLYECPCDNFTAHTGRGVAEVGR